jgi:hypothetical protein
MRLIGNTSAKNLSRRAAVPVTGFMMLLFGPGGGRISAMISVG